MRFFTTLIFAGALSVAAAQDTTTAQTTAATTADPAQSSTESALVKCLDACAPGDVACTAKCVVVPSPDASQANATNECVAACPQGNGTATDNLNYENCVSGCVGRFYFTSTGTPSPTDAAGSNSGGSGSGGSSSVTGAPSSQTGSATGSAAGSASSTSSKAAADIVHVAGPAAGLLGLVAAILAL